MASSLEARIRARVRKVIGDFASEDAVIEEICLTALGWIHANLPGYVNGIHGAAPHEANWIFRFLPFPFYSF